MASAMDLSEMDWALPWFDSVRDSAKAVGPVPDWRAALNRLGVAQGLRNYRDLPLFFVEQATLPHSTAYETYIAETGCIPTRPNFHDYFNGLMWLSFPHIKRQLNALQASEIRIRGSSHNRGPVRDAATLFDENGALLMVSDDAQGRTLTQLLRGRDWHGALFERRAWFGKHVKVFLFGHALLEKLLNPFKSITAHTLVVNVSSDFFTVSPATMRCTVDRQVAEELAGAYPETVNTSMFTPLPVLGIPSWWPGQDAAFYADSSVFRAKRQT